MSLDEIRAAVAKVKQATIDRSVAPQDMVNYTITLSNFGMLAGRYATPLMVPPTVAILGTGKLQHDVVAVMGGIEVHRRIPLSLSFDHRCVTGGPDQTVARPECLQCQKSRIVAPVMFRVV